jgi:ABC-type multidrug transport system ATPase subunit
MSSSVSASNLAKSFGSTRALDDMSFDVNAGELFGFIGPDGAGKTTLFRVLVTLMVPDVGRATVLGLDVVRDLWALRRRIGYMAGRFSLYPDLSVEENLRFFASVFGTTLEREREHIAPIYDQIAPFRDRRAAALSGGMKQKLALCCALVHRPDVLFLDEPTTGIDAVSRRELWDLLGALRAQGMTIIVSTPYMDEANRCDRVALMQAGRIIALDSPAAIAASLGRPLFAVRTSARHQVLHALRAFPHAHSAFPFGDVHHVTDDRVDVEPHRAAEELRTYLTQQGFDDADVSPAAPTVEDVFIERMGAPMAPASPAP